MATAFALALEKPRPPSSESLEMAGQIRSFLLRHGELRAFEDGLLVARISTQSARSGYTLNAETGRLLCHFWSEQSNLVRRVVHVAAQGSRLRLCCQRLAQAKPTLLVLEPLGDEASAGELQRSDFRQSVVAAIRREWPQWKLSGGPGPAGPVQCLTLKRARSVLACAAIGPGESPAALAGVLTRALAWAHALRTQAAHSKNSAFAGLRLIAPLATPGIEARIPWLQFPVEVFHLDSSAGLLHPWPPPPADPLLDSQLRLPPAAEPPFPASALALAQQIRLHCPQCSLEWTRGGGLRFRLYGLEIARSAAAGEHYVAEYFFGYGVERTPLLPSNQALFTAFLQRLGAQRLPGGDRRHPLFTLQPEAWMEHLLRHDFSSAGLGCDPRFVYSQLPITVPGQRDILDLLAVGRDGRLIVIELKADEDLGFPLQALDYWERVRLHHERGDFARLGYFPGVRLSPLPPRLWLMAPALRWHPATPALLAAIATEVGIERFGLNENWRQGLQVVERWSNGC